MLLFPPGDNWGTVGLRLSLLVLAAGGVYWWVNFTRRKLPDLFRGKLSDETLGALTREEQGDEQKTATGAVLKNWELPLIAILAFCVAFGVIDFNNPWLNMNGASPRARGLVRLIAWCCGNPNTLVSLSVLVGLGALGLYSYRIVRAAIQYKGVPETKGM